MATPSTNTPPAAALDTGPAPQTTRTQPLDAPEAPTTRGTGSPDAREGAGDTSIAAPSPTSPPASAPRLNLELPRSRDFQGMGPRGLLPLLPAPPERKSKLAEGIEKSARPDCRTAHSDKGLLGVVPLVGDAIKDKGCRW
jgi:hypothetical protein